MDHSQVPVSALDGPFVQQLFDDRVPESATLDYKSRFSLLKTDQEKRDYLKDACALANARGGLIVWGIEEVDGVPTQIVGIGDDSVDEGIRQREQLVAKCTEPPIYDLRTIQVSVGERRLVVQRIGRGLTGPHMITLGGSDRFYIRMSRHNEPMDYGGIRRAFTASEERIDAVRRLRSQRIARIVARETPVHLEHERLVALHVVPIISRTSPLHAAAIRAASAHFGTLWADGPGSARINFDGVAFHDGTYREDGTSMYCQVFRSGMVEAVGPAGSFTQDRLPMPEIEHRILQRASEYVHGLLGLDFTYPFAIGVTLIGVKGCKIFQGHEAAIGYAHPIRDELLLVPEVVVESPDDAIDVALCDACDWMWNAAGHLRSPHFDDLRRWNGVD